MFLTCKNVLSIMERQTKGVIINISSIASIRYTGSPSVSYNASKGAVNQLTQNIAVQYAPKRYPCELHSSWPYEHADDR
jgi:NAD(P)-dependent dehydrogenase (short-subunit alcohol dehydrogenase family)